MNYSRGKMDWIHCNSCFSQPIENNANLQFYLTSCGHIFCENCGCYADDASNSCKLCRSTCSSTLMGDKVLIQFVKSFRANPQVKEYFQESEGVCEKLIEVMKFQKAHRLKLIGHHQRIVSKYNRAKAYIKKLENELKIAKNALRNVSQTSYNYSTPNTTTQSITTPIFHPTSAPFKMINAESKICNTPSVKQKIPDMKHRKQSFRNELSMLSSGSDASRFQTPSNCSSIYASPLPETFAEKFTSKIDRLHLNAFSHRLQKK